MAIMLIMRSADGVEQPFPITRQRTLIGRDSRSDLRIAVPAVAARHCELVRNGETVTVSDLETTAGTFVNGRRIESTVLSHADELKVGPVTFQVRVDNGELNVPEVQIERRQASRTVRPG